MILHNILERLQRLGEGVVGVELQGAVPGLRAHVDRKKDPYCGKKNSPHDGLLSSFMVMRHSVRASFGSVSVAECSSEALSQTTTSPTPYFRRYWYFGCVAWSLSSSRTAPASSSGMPSIAKDVPPTA